MHNVEVTNIGKTSFKAKTKTAEFTMDSEGKGVSPVEALLASLGGCVGVYIRRFLEANKLTTDFSVKVYGELEIKERPHRFKSISVDVDLLGLKLDADKTKQLIEIAQHCPVHNTLRNNPEIEIKITGSP